MAPTVQAFLLADAVFQDRATGKHVIAGTFTHLTVPGFPAVHSAPIAAFVALTGLDGAVTLALRLVAPSGRVVIKSSAVEITCTDRRLLVELGFPVPSLPLPEAGWYRLDLLLDDAELATLAFDVEAR